MFTQDQWNRLLAEQIEIIKTLSTLKGGEYAGDVDRLANFRRNAADVGVNMETCWRIYAGKHWDAISQYVKDRNDGTMRTRSEPIEGRVDDLIVYLLLFKAILAERAEPKDATAVAQTCATCKYRNAPTYNPPCSECHRANERVQANKWEPYS